MVVCQLRSSRGRTPGYLEIVRKGKAYPRLELGLHISRKLSLRHDGGCDGYRTVEIRFSDLSRKQKVGFVWLIVGKNLSLRLSLYVVVVF